ncbi:alpha-2-HS-glycoprotein 1 [Lepisosteus oculatus]|uniref:alpha-2-HS-glycoprotein 1 n=1 Tax=Lepisosteus oculatus TaxID=7918 RepID=UPI0035F5179A
METAGALAFLSLLAAAWAAGLPPAATLQGARFPPCDSAEAEAAALAAVDFINAQHHHGYKHTLNRIEEVRVLPRLPAGETYIMELDLLETKCHVVSPTPAQGCPVRPLVETKVEGDCDVILSKVDGAFTVTAYKCKSKPDSAEDVSRLCVGCPSLLPLNDTLALQAVTNSLTTFNAGPNETAHFELMEVGRLASQVVGGGAMYITEFAIVETNCTDLEAADPQAVCVPLSESLARHGFCTGSVLPGVPSEPVVTVDCDIFGAAGPEILIVSNDSQAVPAGPPAGPPVVHHHEHAGQGPHSHGFKHHQLTAVHGDVTPGLFSSESAEAAPAPVPAQVVKREVAAAPPVPAAPGQAAVPLPAVCPGRVRHF